MNVIQIKLETVTPLLLHGTSPEGPPELRPPAFRGALRYWFRAAAGGVIGDENLAGLHQMERAVFGSAEHGSPVSLQVKGDLSKQVIKAPILPHHPDSATRYAFDKNQIFRLVAKQRPSGQPEHDELIWLNFCMAINLAILFGGVGLRSRRGYGTLKIVESDSALVPKSPIELDKWKTLIRVVTRSAIKNAQGLAQNLGIDVSELPTSPASYPSASQGGLVWLPAQPQSETSDDILKYLMSKMPKNPAFGGISPRRQASPLWARVIQADRQYRLLFCLLPSIPDAEKIREFLATTFPGEPISIEGWNQ